MVGHIAKEGRAECLRASSSATAILVVSRNPTPYLNNQNEGVKRVRRVRVKVNSRRSSEHKVCLSIGMFKDKKWIYRLDKYCF